MTIQLLTVKETCQLLKIGRTKLYDLIKSGDIKPHKVSGIQKTYFKSDEVQRFVSKIE